MHFINLIPTIFKQLSTPGRKYGVEGRGGRDIPNFERSYILVLYI